MLASMRWPRILASMSDTEPQPRIISQISEMDPLVAGEHVQDAEGQEFVVTEGGGFRNVVPFPGSDDLLDELWHDLPHLPLTVLLPDA